ncbi:MAG: DUF2520 domain-containing protein [Bacteroidaceae bacterium]|nr:DUF2520 domain-containing protein [Bacteroidaceae bacterium]
MRITIIGAGRVASSFAPALAASGCSICQVWSRTSVSARQLAALVGAEAISGDFSAVIPDTDLVIVSVKDSVLRDVVDELRVRTHAPIVHTAGSMSGDIADGVLYPLQTFSMERQVDFAHVHFFLEAADKILEQILVGLCGLVTPAENIHLLDSAGRSRLHLAAVFACNFANHCCTLAEQILHSVGVDFDVLLPLVEETAAKLRELPPSVAQTGPAVRGDENIIVSQSTMLDQMCKDGDNTLPADIYRLMSRSIMRVAADSAVRHNH